MLVQVCQVSVNPNDVDVEGNASRYTHTVGSGQVVLYRNGKRIIGKWSRPNSTSATTYTDPTGKPLEMSPGNTIVALPQRRASADRRHCCARPAECGRPSRGRHGIRRAPRT